VSFCISLHHSLPCQISALDDRFNETSSAQGTKIEGQKEYEWGHSGRENSPSGTEGSFEVRLTKDGKDGDLIGKVYWDCPYIGKNTLSKSDVKNDYEISFEGFSIPNGALGKGKINIRKD
jgi:hypothetical protein